MSRILFIDETYLKETSVIDDNVDMKVVNPTIDECQDYYIHPVLGTDLFEDIKTSIDNNSVSAAYQTLLNNYIRPALSKWVQYELMINNRIKVRNNVTGIPTADNMQIPDISEMKFYMDRIKSKAEWYSQRITNFLCEYETDYPKYTSNSDGDDIYPSMTSYQTGMVLPNYRPIPKGLKVDYGDKKGWRSLNS